MHGSIYEAKICASVEHVQVDGGAGFDDIRHCLQDLFKENKEEGCLEWVRAQGKPHIPVPPGQFHHWVTQFPWTIGSQ